MPYPRDTGLSRRELLKQASVTAILYMAWSRSARAGSSSPDFPWGLTLPVLLPIPVENPEATFAEIARAIESEIDARSPQLKSGILKEIDGQMAKIKGRPTTSQITRLLDQAQSNAKFPAFLAVASRHCFRHPAIWAAIGYQGSSVEYGGYLDRGFNDISWL